MNQSVGACSSGHMGFISSHWFYMIYQQIEPFMYCFFVCLFRPMKSGVDLQSKPHLNRLFWTKFSKNWGHFL